MKKLILILATILFSVSHIHSQPQKMQHGFLKEDGRLVKLLKLTDEQTKKFNDLKYNAEQKSIDLRSQIQKNRLDLRKLMSEKELDSKKILDLTKKNSEIQSKLKEIHIKTLLDLNNILTNEQKEIFAQHRSKMNNMCCEEDCPAPLKRMPRHRNF